MAEGTRGGKIIGHTSSGKPIYQSATNAKYKDFSAKDHHEAYVAHSVMGQRAQDKKDHGAAALHGKQQHYHRNSFEAHEHLGTKIPSYDQSLGRVKLAKSEESMSNDIFKSMGITVGEAPSLLHSRNETVGEAADQSNQIVRKGLAGNARDRLEGHISKGFGGPGIFVMPVPPRHAQPSGQYGDENLKNTHGEQFHSDNDKQVESMVTTAGEVDRVFDIETIENPMTDFGCNVGRKRKEPAGAIQRSMSREDLLLKALDDLTVEKSFKGPPRVGTGKKAPRMEKDPEQVKEERQQKKELLGKSDSLIEYAEEKTSPDLIANVHENYDGVNEKLRPSELLERSLDELMDMSKGGPGSGKRGHTSARSPGQIRRQRQKNEDAHSARVGVSQSPEITGMPKTEAHEEPEEKTQHEKEWDEHGGRHGQKSMMDELVDLVKAAPAPAPRQIDIGARMQRMAKRRGDFVKAAGPGGVVFDFGATTGNKIADNATALLNAHGDPVQMSNAQYQSGAYDKAITDYVTKGDSKFSSEATPFGNVDKAWAGQLNKPFDQQVAESFKKGELSEDPNAPAVKNAHNEKTITMGGNVIKATSETDEFVLAMMEKQQGLAGDGSGVIDASNGGKISICAGE